MYLGSFDIDDYVGIPADTHRFSSGAAYAPTSLTYSIYEDSTAVGLDEDVDMTPASPFDSIVGHYWARRQLTAAAGFEAGKNYHVVVKATVDSVSAIATHIFQIKAKVDVRAVEGSDPTDQIRDSIVDDATRIDASALNTLSGKAPSKSYLAGTNNSDGDIQADEATGNFPGSVGSVAAGVTVTTNNDKTGYALSATAVQAVWEYATRTLSSYGTLVSDVATAVWAAGTRTLTSFGTLVADIWANATRTLSAFAFSVTVGTNSDKTGYSLSVTPPTANENADALLDRANAIETGWTLRKMLRIVFSALGAKLSGAGTTTVTIRDVPDTKARITATVDSDGNRTAVTLDGD